MYNPSPGPPNFLAKKLTKRTKKISKKTWLFKNFVVPLGQVAKPRVEDWGVGGGAVREQWSKCKVVPAPVLWARAGGSDGNTQEEQQEEQPRRNRLAGAGGATRGIRLENQRQVWARRAYSFLTCGCESIYPLTLIINFYSLLASVIFRACRMCRLRELKFHYTYSGGAEGLKRRNSLFGYPENVSYIYKKLKHMTIQEIKKQVAKLIIDKKNAWEITYKDREPTQFEKDTYKVYADEKDAEISRLIPASEKLSICLTGCAEGELSHYDIEHSLQTVFKAGDGIQYDSEGGQFWVYVKSSLVQKVLRHIDYHFPGGIKLNVSPNNYADNPWFQNWDQARKYLKEIEQEN